MKWNAVRLVLLVVDLSHAFSPQRAFPTGGIRRGGLTGPLRSRMEDLAREWKARNADQSAESELPSTLEAFLAPPAPPQPTNSLPPPSSTSDEQPTNLETFLASPSSSPSTPVKQTPPPEAASVVIQSTSTDDAKSAAKKSPVKKVTSKTQGSAKKKETAKTIKIQGNPPPKAKGASVTKAQRTVDENKEKGNPFVGLGLSFGVSVALLASLPFIQPPLEQQSGSLRDILLDATKLQYARLEKAMENSIDRSTPSPFRKLHPKPAARTLKSFGSFVAPEVPQTVPKQQQKPKKPLSTKGEKAATTTEQSTVKEEPEKLVNPALNGGSKSEAEAEPNDNTGTITEVPKTEVFPEPTKGSPIVKEEVRVETPTQPAPETNSAMSERMEESKTKVPTQSPASPPPETPREEEATNLPRSVMSDSKLATPKADSVPNFPVFREETLPSAIADSKSEEAHVQRKSEEDATKVEPKENESTTARSSSTNEPASPQTQISKQDDATLSVW